MTYDVVVVGGGAAGLTAAAYAARAGKRVALIEQQQTLGGLVQSINRNDFVFDMGLRAIENSGIVLPMVRELELPFSHVQSHVSLGIADRIITVHSEDPEEAVAQYRDLLVDLYPASEADVDRIISVVRRIMKDMDVLYGIDNPLFHDLKRDYGYIFGTLLPWMVRFLFTIGRINRMNEPVEQFLAGLTENESLRDIIGQHFFRNTPTFFAMSYFSVYLDYLYPLGGTGTLMNALEEFCRRSGVEIFMETQALRVDPEALTLGLRHGDGERDISGRSIVWAADLTSLYTSVDDESIRNPKMRRAVTARRDELTTHRGGDSVFSVFLSVDLPPEYFRKISHGHFFYTPDQVGLGNLYISGLQALPARMRGVEARREEVRDYMRRFLARNTFEISIPVLKDPALAPPGKTGLIVSWLLDYDLISRVHDDGWYEEFKEFCMDEITALLSRTVYPGLDTAVLDRFTSSPLSIKQYTGNRDGAITGWAFPSPGGAMLPVPSKMQEVSRSVRTPMKGIYKAGQWVYSPSGLPIALLTGKLAAQAAQRAVRYT